MYANLDEIVESRIQAAALTALNLTLTAEETVVRPASAGRDADIQSNVAMALAKRLGRPSRDIATDIVSHLDRDGFAAVEVAGPGFINIRIANELLSQTATSQAGHDQLGVALADPALRVVIDYSSPNMAKEAHVGHLRSTVIGDALARLNERLGHTVIRHNHLGDWGTPMGMLIEHMIDSGGGVSRKYSVADLSAFYAQARQKFDSDEAFAARSRARVVALQAGEEETLQLWTMLIDESKRHIEELYALLDVTLTPSHYRGESVYNDRLEATVQELKNRGLARISDGAVCVFPEGFTGRDGTPTPLIIEKSGGGYGYATTDLATIRYRADDLKGDRLIYVVGAPQKTHFAMIFATATEVGWIEGDEPVHVAFGSVLGPDKKVLRSREGVSLKLIDLLNDAISHADAVLQERSATEGAERAAIARAVGVGAIKYADLSNSRESDYVFSLDRMLAKEGNTSVYLQYAHARIRSLAAKTTPEVWEEAASAAISVEHSSERRLAIELDRYSRAMTTTAHLNEPHRLCTYLFDLATAFSSFYENCPVLAAPNEAVRNSRLRLSMLTADVLADGLAALGIAAPERL